MRACYCTLPYTDPKACDTCPNNTDREVARKDWVFDKGWQCPICGRVYSPSTIMCLFCRKKDDR